METTNDCQLPVHVSIGVVTKKVVRRSNEKEYVAQLNQIVMLQEENDYKKKEASMLIKLSMTNEMLPQVQDAKDACMILRLEEMH